MALLGLVWLLSALVGSCGTMVCARHEQGFGVRGVPVLARFRFHSLRPRMSIAPSVMRVCVCLSMCVCVFLFVCVTVCVCVRACVYTHVRV